MHLRVDLRLFIYLNIIFFEKKNLILLKFYYLVLDAKLLINHVESFFSLENL